MLHRQVSSLACVNTTTCSRIMGLPSWWCRPVVSSIRSASTLKTTTPKAAPVSLLSSSAEGSSIPPSPAQQTTTQASSSSWWSTVTGAGGADGSSSSSSTRQWLLLGAMFLVGGALLDLFSSRKEVLVTKLLEYFVTTVQVRSHQEAFPMIVDLITSLPDAEASVRNFMVNGGPSIGAGSDDCGSGGTGAEDSCISLRPGLGTYMLNYKGTWMSVSRGVDSDRSKAVNLTNDLPQVITITLWTTDKTVAVGLLEDAHALHKSKRGSETKVYIPDASGYGWQYLGSRLKRDAWTLFFPPHIQEGVSQEVSTYLKSESMYRQLGVPWRRGYLFYGPPGTGKSSFISALAAEHDLPVYLLQNLGSSSSSTANSDRSSLLDVECSGSGGGGGGSSTLPRDDQLLSLLNSCARPSIVVLEDLDTSAAAASTTTSASSPRISGLLNALDGIASTDGRIIIATANRSELIPAALRRPGRIDREVLFDHMAEEERARMHAWYSSTIQDQNRQCGGILDSPILSGMGGVKGFNPDAAGSVAAASEVTPAELQHRLLSELLYVGAPTSPEKPRSPR